MRSEGQRLSFCEPFHQISGILLLLLFFVFFLPPLCPIARALTPAGILDFGIARTYKFYTGKAVVPFVSKGFAKRCPG